MIYWADFCKSDHIQNMKAASRASRPLSWKMLVVLLYKNGQINYNVPCLSSQEKLKQTGCFLTPVNRSVQLIVEFMKIYMLWLGFEGGQENIAKKISHMLPKTRQILTHMKKNPELWKSIKFVREERIFCLWNFHCRRERPLFITSRNSTNSEIMIEAHWRTNVDSSTRL